MDEDKLEELLEQMIKIVPRGFSVTVALRRTESALIAHAAVHTQEPDAVVVIQETGDSPVDAARKLRARLEET